MSKLRRSGYCSRDDCSLSTHQITGKRILHLLVAQIPTSSVMMPMTPVGICMRTASKPLKPKPLVMRPPNAPMPPDGIAVHLWATRISA